MTGWSACSPAAVCQPRSASRDLIDWLVREQARNIHGLNTAIHTVTRGKVMLGMR